METNVFVLQPIIGGAELANFTVDAGGNHDNYDPKTKIFQMINALLVFGVGHS